MKVIIRIRGTVKLRHDVKMAFEMLKLPRVNNMALVLENQTSLGQLTKVESYSTFGEISPQVLEKVLEKRGRLPGDKKITQEFLKLKGFKSFEELAKSLIEGKNSLKDLGINRTFRLHPPRKGHERQGIKKSFSVGGTLGNRGEEINYLILKML